MSAHMKRFEINKQSVKDPNGGWVNYTDVCIDTNPAFAYKLTAHEIIILEQAARLEAIEAAAREVVQVCAEYTPSTYSPSAQAIALDKLAALLDKAGTG